MTLKPPRRAGKPVKDVLRQQVLLRESGNDFPTDLQQFLAQRRHRPH